MNHYLDAHKPFSPVTQPENIEFCTADGVFIKQIHLPTAGSIVPQHAHQFSHHSMLARGSIKAWADGIELGEFKAPYALYIKAGVKHTFLTLEPDTIIYCIHNLHGKEGVEVVEHHEIGG